MLFVEDPGAKEGLRVIFAPFLQKGWMYMGFTPSHPLI
jgi:hypothetical protein